MTAKPRFFPSPYGMDKCCICDSPDVAYAIPTPKGELLPHCPTHAATHRKAFPRDQVFLYTPKVS